MFAVHLGGYQTLFRSTHSSENRKNFDLFRWPTVGIAALIFLVRVASSEVILSSGAVGSPRLLQLSGIGPAAYLETLGIDVVYDQPQVGENLQDHLDLYCICELSGPYSYDLYAKPAHAALAGIQYLLTKKGPVASSLFETGGFWYADPKYKKI